MTTFINDNFSSKKSSDPTATRRGVAMATVSNQDTRFKCGAAF